MKPTKLKKLGIQRESLRLLTSDELREAGGGRNGTVDWCSTESLSKCATHVTSQGCDPNRCYKRA